MTTPLDNLRVHVDERFDRLEVKLDGYTDRLARAETDLTWLRGAGKLALTIVISALGTIAGAVLKYLH